MADQIEPKKKFLSPIILIVGLIIVVAVILFVIFLSRTENDSEMGSDSNNAVGENENNPDNQVSQIEYTFLFRRGPQSYDPFPSFQYQHSIAVSVPNDTTLAQLDQVFESVQKDFDLPARFELVIYNQEDIGADEDINFDTSLPEPIKIYIFSPWGVDHVFSRSRSVVYKERGRNGEQLPQNCIALDLHFAIVSYSTVEQLRDYYNSADSPFQEELNFALTSFPNYISADLSYEERNYDYDVLIKLFEGDNDLLAAEDYYQSFYESLTPLSQLQQIVKNGC